MTVFSLYPNNVNPDLLAEQVILNQSIIGPVRATALYKLASEGLTRQSRALGRNALQVAAAAAGRDSAIKADGTLIQDRVYSKASNARLRNWSQDHNSPD